MKDLTPSPDLDPFPGPDLPYISDMDAFLERQGIDCSLCPAFGEGKMRCVHDVPSFHDPPQRYPEAA
jgi:hypothetical protein